MPIGAALRGFGAIMKGGKRSPTISSVKPSVHTTKKAQKTQRMKEQFDKQMSRTRSDRRMGKADGGPITPREVLDFELNFLKALPNPLSAAPTGIIYLSLKH